jgi:hypothetical protein
MLPGEWLKIWLKCGVIVLAGGLGEILGKLVLDGWDRMRRTP